MDEDDFEIFFTSIFDFDEFFEEISQNQSELSSISNIPSDVTTAAAATSAYQQQ